MAINDSPKRLKVYLPLVFAVLLGGGFYLGTILNFSGNGSTIFIQKKSPYNKVNSVLNYVEQEYVDTVNQADLIETTITQMLANLDPHSSYIPAKELKEITEPLEGNFEGIGIEFNVLRDTIRVVSVVPGGPSEQLGILAGDKIVQIDGKSVAAIKISNNEVRKKLKGKRGTKVTVGIQRKGAHEILDFIIIRGTIPIYSVDVAYMLNAKTGYIKISRFAETTFAEYISAFEKLRAKGMENMILDLRGNGGGLLEIAVELADEFLPEREMIVYTQGKNQPKEDHYATNKGKFEKSKLVALIDEESASASEILAGAIQDNDRGLIVGRRTFGKGLVQRQTMFRDSSAMRLTVARYYTPSGRCIQKPYGKGLENYYSEEAKRYENGQLMHADSIHFSDSLKYKTLKGRTVFGGGGIMPDVFVPLDTTGRTRYLSELFMKGLFNQFAYDYLDKERKNVETMGAERFFTGFFVNKNLFNDFIAYAEKNNLKRNQQQIRKSEKLIKNYLKAVIARGVWGNDSFYPILNLNDNILHQAMEEISKME